MRLVGYIRVSTVKQIEGTSLTTQKERIETFCKMQGHELVQIFADEGRSGKHGSDRPQYDNMIRRLKEDPTITGIVISALSRLGRSLPDVVALIYELQVTGRFFVSLKENIDMSTKEGRMLFGVIAVINEYERELIIERMGEGREYADVHGSKSGKPCNRPKKQINWIVVEDLRRPDPPLSWSAIAKALNAGVDDPKKRISKQTLINQAKERGMKI